MLDALAKAQIVDLGSVASTVADADFSLEKWLGGAADQASEQATATDKVLYGADMVLLWC